MTGGCTHAGEYPGDAVHKRGADWIVIPGVISGIRSLIPLILTVIVYFGYRLEDRQVLHMQEEIALR